MEGIIGLIALIVSILLIWAVFSIRRNLEKQTDINIATVRLLKKIAKNTGSDDTDLKDVLDSLSKKL